MTSPQSVFVLFGRGLSHTGFQSISQAGGLDALTLLFCTKPPSDYPLLTCKDPRTLTGPQPARAALVCGWVIIVPLPSSIVLFGHELFAARPLGIMRMSREGGHLRPFITLSKRSFGKRFGEGS